MDKRAAGLATVSGALIALGAYAVAHRTTAGQQVARVIAERMAPQPDAEALEDEHLAADANEAGYRWAERRLLTDDTDCPNLSQDFRAGCIDYVKEESEH
jgi:hypothetical protein